MIRPVLLSALFLLVLAVAAPGQITSGPIGGNIGGATTDPPTREVLFQLDPGSNNGDYRVRSIGSTASHRASFMIPIDFSSLVELQAIGIVSSAGAAGTTKDIDLTSSYGQLGESATVHQESDVVSTFDFPPPGEVFTYDLTSVFSDLSGGDIVGLEIDHNSIGGALDYLGIRLKYD